MRRISAALNKYSSAAPFSTACSDDSESGDDRASDEQVDDGTVENSDDAAPESAGDTVAEDDEIVLRTSRREVW